MDAGGSENLRNMQNLQELVGRPSSQASLTNFPPQHQQQHQQRRAGNVLLPENIMADSTSSSSSDTDDEHQNTVLIFYLFLSWNEYFYNKRFYFNEAKNLKYPCF